MDKKAMAAEIERLENEAVSLASNNPHLASKALRQANTLRTALEIKTKASKSFKGEFIGSYSARGLVHGF